MEWSKLGTDLKEALSFQKDFAKAVCVGLDVCSKDNDVISCFKIMNTTNMPSRQVGLQNWSLSEFSYELETLL